jgi:beta-glucanase (GH16 family)
MRCQNAILAAAGIAGSLPIVSAWVAPEYDGFNKDWESVFIGDSGTLPSEEKWNFIDANLGVNAELQFYKKSTNNVQLSGGETLQIIPRRDGNIATGWTSGRLESKYKIVPEDGKITKAEAVVRFGTNGGKAGMWPAVWMLGDNVGQVGWPACGELDLFEMRNGDMMGHGVVHCDVYPGGICNEGSGIVADVHIPDADWTTWSVVWDQTKGNWMDDTITWYMDGVQYHQISGGRIGNFDVWKSLAQNPMFFIINVAVGGLFPGNPDGNTADGFDSMLEVGYIAAYKSK